MSGDSTREACIEAFCRRDYVGCYRAVSPLLAAAPSPDLMQLALLCLQRLGQSDLVAKASPQFLRQLATSPWQRLLLQLTLGQVERNDVLSLAGNDEQRCQIHHHAGARLLLRGLHEAARREFDACLSVSAACLERRLGEADRASLPTPRPPMPLSSMPPGARPQQPHLPTHPLEHANNHVLQLLRSGDLLQARGAAEQALTMARSLVTERNSLFARALSTLAMVEMKLGNSVRAEQLWRQAAETWSATVGQTHPLYGAVLGRLADLQAKRGQSAQAEQLFRQAIAIHEAYQAERPAILGTTLNSLAELYAAAGRYLEAEPLYRRALDLLATAGPDAAADFDRVLNNLAELCIAMGRPDEAARLRQFRGRLP